MNHSSKHRETFEDMMVSLPKVDIKDRVIEFKPLDDQDSMLRILENGKYDDTVTCFQKKEPEWNEAHKKFYLKFNDRVQKASIKNCQLVKVFKNETIDRQLQVNLS